MEFSFKRILRTESSEQYVVYTTAHDKTHAIVDIHYGERVAVGIQLLMQGEEEIDDKEIGNLIYRLEDEIILSYTSNIDEIYHTVSVGKIEQEYINDQVK